MGQYWEIVNIDKPQSTGHLGEMGEFFFLETPGWAILCFKEI